MQKNDLFDLILETPSFRAFTKKDPESFRAICALAGFAPEGSEVEKRPAAPSPKESYSEAQKQLRIFLCVFALVDEVFEGSQKKIWEWWNQHDPRFGNSSPRSLLLRGNFKRLAAVITKQAISKTKPNGIPNGEIYDKALKTLN